MASFKDEIKLFNKGNDKHKGSSIKITFVIKNNHVYLGYSHTVKNIRIRKQIQTADFPINSDYRPAIRFAKEYISQLLKAPDVQAKTLADTRKREQKRELAKKLIANGGINPNGLHTLCDKWTEHFGERTSRNHMIMTTKLMKQFKPWSNPMKSIDEVTKAECGDFVTFVEQYLRPNGKTYDKVSIFCHIKNLRLFWNWLCKHDYSEKNPAQFIEYKRPEKPVQFFTTNELALLKVAEDSVNPRSQDMVQVFWFIRFTGVRPVDIKNFRFCDLGEVINGKYVPNEVAEFTQHKTNTIGHVIQASITPRTILINQFEKYGSNLEEKVFKLPHNTHLGKYFDQWLTSAKVPKNGRGMYKAKHSLGTQLGKMGLSEREIGLFFGHSTGRGATKNYISPDFSRVIWAQKQIDQ